MRKMRVFMLVLTIFLTAGVVFASNYDKDRDGVNDRADLCPQQKEIVNGFEDSDGCPDTIFIRMIGKIRGPVKGGVVTIVDNHGKQISFKVKRNLFEWITNIPCIYSIRVDNGRCSSNWINIYPARGEIVKVILPVRCSGSKDNRSNKNKTFPAR